MLTVNDIRAWAFAQAAAWLWRDNTHCNQQSLKNDPTWQKSILGLPEHL